MKNVKRILSVFLVLALLVSAGLCLNVHAETDDSADRLRYIPIQLVVSDNAVKVTGYFANLNEDITITELTDVEMHIYLDGELLLEGSFGDIDVVLEPLGLARWTLTFKGEHDLNNGTYSCSDFYYASFACSFAYTD